MNCKRALASLSLIAVSAFAQQPGPSGPPAAIDAAPADVAGPGVARISFLSGDVSVKRGDSGEAVAAAMNAPLLVADTIATGPEARAEVQFDSGHRLRLGNDVEARVAEIQSGRFRMELAHGTVMLSVLRDGAGQAEISTPTVSFRPLQRGLYRISVGDDRQTAITVRAGRGEIFSLKGTEQLNAGQTMEVRGSPDDPEFQIVAAIQRDEWDSWNENRDASLNRSESYRYVNPGIPGAEDLDGQGSWINDPAYGEVWAPRVDPDWAPYRDGRWVWEDYYGWTWLSADPWGWAPYHYGNWYRGSVGWCWYPGSFYRPVFWRPALVAFFGFGGFGFGVGFGGWGNIGWLPLAPFEAFHPWYGRGFSGGFDRRYLAVNNYHITNVNITNIYRNARVNGAISGVAAGSFASGRFSSITRVNAEQVRNAGLVRGALPIAPTANNLRFSSRATAVTPRAFDGVRFSGPARSSVNTRVPFEQQRQAIQQSTARFSQSMTSPMNRQMGAASIPQSNGNSAWGRFGTPNRAAPTGYNPNRTSSVPGWGRFGSPNSSGATPAIRLSQPMVHNRSYDQPSGYRQPSYSAPRSAYGGSAYPAYGAYGGGQRSTYNAPRTTYSAPQSSHAAAAPAHSSGGSSGGHSGGGGGGGSHHR